MTEPAELMCVDSNEVACDGGDPVLGHPNVYLRIGSDGYVDCPYCGRRFVRRIAEGAAD